MSGQHDVDFGCTAESIQSQEIIFATWPLFWTMDTPESNLVPVYICKGGSRWYQDNSMNDEKL